MRVTNFKLGGVVCPILSMLQFRQTIEPIDGGRALFRTVDGTGIKRTAYEKMRIAWSGEGRLPLALAGLDYAAGLSLECGGPRVLYSASGSGLEVPGSYRSGDHAPAGFAYVDEKPIRTDVVITDGVAELDPVVGADFYQLRIWPIYTVTVVSRPEEFDDMAARFPWAFVAEEL